jgi:DNA polymerase III subunit gamma/tau
MSYMALYREWRPRVFEDLIGQDHIVKTLKNQLISGRVPHAYLFCGTRGTGKTSTAKILSKAVNCLNPHDGDPCNVCEICLETNEGTLIDVVEMDAASNRKIEHARDLIETVKYPPHKARHKVYIIDEVHMLTTEAFNALLKTIEEPPSYVIFILATTDPQKVPATILSRCQRFDFKRIKTDNVAKRLRKIVSEKGIYAEDEALEAIARVSDGAMRDALSILDQAISMSNGKIEYSDIGTMLGLTSNRHMFNLVDSMSEGDVEAAIKMIDEIILNGKDILQFIKDLTKHFRNLLMIKISKTPENIIDAGEDAINNYKEQSKRLRSEEIMRGINILVEAENEAKLTSQWRILLEMAVIKFCRREYDTSIEMVLNRLNMLEDKIKSGDVVVSISNKNEAGAAQVIKKALEKPKQEKQILENNEVYDSNTGSISLDEVRGAWQDMLNLIKGSRKMSIYAWLINGDPSDIKGNNITITFNDQYSFSKTNLERPENKSVVEENFSKALNKPVKITYKVLEKDNQIEEGIEKAKRLLGEDIIEIIE